MLTGVVEWTKRLLSQMHARPGRLYADITPHQKRHLVLGKGAKQLQTVFESDAGAMVTRARALLLVDFSLIKNFTI